MVLDDPYEGFHHAVVCGRRLGLQGRAVEGVEEVVLRGPGDVACGADVVAEAADRVLVEVGGVEAKSDAKGKGPVADGGLGAGRAHLEKRTALSTGQGLQAYLYVGRGLALPDCATRCLSVH